MATNMTFGRRLAGSPVSFCRRDRDAARGGDDGVEIKVAIVATLRLGVSAARSGRRKRCDEASCFRAPNGQAVSPIFNMGALAFATTGRTLPDWRQSQAP